MRFKVSHIILWAGLLLGSLPLCAGVRGTIDTTAVRIDTDVLTLGDTLDVKANYPGGFGALVKYLGTNTLYPEEALQQGIEGTVLVRFIVNKDGSISDVVVLKSVHHLLDSEAIRVISSMPNWTPAVKNGNPVRLYFKLPIAFRGGELKSAKKGRKKRTRD